MNVMERNAKNVTIVLALATCGNAVTTVYAASIADGWHGSGDERLYKEQGKPKTAWLFLEEGTYYLNEEGKPLTGWQTINQDMFYFDSEGLRVSGRVEIDGQLYHFQSAGQLLNGWQQNRRMYYDAYGVFLTGAQHIEGYSYLFDEQDMRLSGWHEVDGTTFYYQPDGTMAVSETIIEETAYNFSADGTIRTGMYSDMAGMRYYDAYGYQLTGWQTIDEAVYYFDEQSGYAYVDCEFEGWHFDEDGTATKVELPKPDSIQETPDVDINTIAASIAASQVGSAYVYGGSSPGGFDFSGLIYYAYAQCGIAIPRTAQEQGAVGYALSYGTMQPGDIIVWNRGEHASLYIGNNQMIHALNPATGVVISDVTYYQAHSTQVITAIRRP